ncbi:hypothetical protein ACFFRR_006606 [Megaselia abdita]
MNFTGDGLVNLDSFLREARAINEELNSFATNKRKLSEEGSDDSNKKGKLNDSKNEEDKDDCEIIEKEVPLIVIQDEIDESTQPSTSTGKQEVSIPEDLPNYFRKSIEGSSSSSSLDSSSGISVKQEACTSSDCPTTSEATVVPPSIPGLPVVVPSVKQEPSTVVKQEASSSTRDSCKYGVKCYRRGNPSHNREMAHPGDSDYRRPDFPDPPKGTPPCPFGMNCYRRNPVHFQQFSHSEQALKPKRNKTRPTTVGYGILSDEEEDEEDNEDFSGDSMDEFIVGDNAVDDEDTDDETDCNEE